jgi:hypothetical protein
MIHVPVRKVVTREELLDRAGTALVDVGRRLECFAREGGHRDELIKAYLDIERYRAFLLDTLLEFE